MKKIFTVGVFDFFHLGHLNFLLNSKKQGNYLIVAIQKNVKKYKPSAKLIYNLRQRIKIISALRCVDKVIIYNDVDKIIKKVDFDIFAIGPDQKHRGFQNAIKYCKENNKKVVIIRRTEKISSTSLRVLVSKLI